MDPPASLSAPIHSIPPETIIYLFREIAYGPNQLMGLALVCRSWRDIVFGTSELWNHIKLHRNVTKGNLRKQLKLSGEALLVLDIDRDTRSKLTKLLLEWNSPKPITERVVNLTFLPGYGYDVSAMLTLSAGHSWPQLRQLVLEGFDETLMDNPDEQKLCVHLHAPKLEKLELRILDVRDWSHIGFGSALCDLQWETAESGHPNVAAFWHAAAQCPNLRRLKWKDSQMISTLPGIPEDGSLWPKLNELDLECMGASLGDTFAILSHAPYLTKLRLRIRELVYSKRPVLPYSKFTPGLRELSLDMVETPANASVRLLRMELLQDILDLCNPATLEKVYLRQITAIGCGIPAQYPLLQDIELALVDIPCDFADSLRQCRLLRRVVTHRCNVRDTFLFEDDGDTQTSGLVLSGGAFTNVCTQLQTLELDNAIVYPEFVTQLEHHPHLETLDLKVLSVSTEVHTAEDWHEIELLTPLPELRRITIEPLPVYEPSGRRSYNNPAYFSFDASAAWYIVSAAAQLARNISKGGISLRLTPLRVPDLARFLSNPDRPLFKPCMHFQGSSYDSEVLDTLFVAYDPKIRPFDVSRPSFALVVGIQMIEFTNLADMLLTLFPLDSDIEMIGLSAAFAAKIRMACKQNPDAAGLRYLLRRAEAKLRIPPDPRRRGIRVDGTTRGVDTPISGFWATTSNEDEL